LLLPTTVAQMALIYDDVDPDTTCGCLVVC
jgi:hypothetical protein